jgi:hypothetical protein
MVEKLQLLQDLIISKKNKNLLGANLENEIARPALALETIVPEGTCKLQPTVGPMRIQSKNT